ADNSVIICFTEVGCARHHKLMGGKKKIKIDHLGQQLIDLHLSATGKQCDDRSVAQAIICPEVRIRPMCGNGIQQRVSDICYLEAEPPVKIHFKRQNTEHVVHHALYLMYTSFVPSPNFWRYVVTNAYTVFFCKRSDFQVKTGKID